MTLKRCAWGKCKSDTRYSQREDMKEVSFRPFILQLCGRPHDQLNENKL